VKNRKGEDGIEERNKKRGYGDTERDYFAEGVKEREEKKRG
jgi:hypothetical protein